MSEISENNHYEESDPGDSVDISNTDILESRLTGVTKGQKPENDSVSQDETEILEHDTRTEQTIFARNAEGKIITTSQIKNREAKGDNMDKIISDGISRYLEKYPDTSNFNLEAFLHELGDLNKNFSYFDIDRIIDILFDDNISFRDISFINDSLNQDMYARKCVEAETIIRQKKLSEEDTLFILESLSLMTEPAMKKFINPETIEKAAFLLSEYATKNPEKLLEEELKDEDNVTIVGAKSILTHHIKALNQTGNSEQMREAVDKALEIAGASGEELEKISSIVLSTDNTTIIDKLIRNPRPYIEAISKGALPEEIDEIDWMIAVANGENTKTEGIDMLASRITGGLVGGTLADVRKCVNEVVMDPLHSKAYINFLANEDPHNLILLVDLGSTFDISKADLINYFYELEILNNQPNHEMMILVNDILKKEPKNWKKYSEAIDVLVLYGDTSMRKDLREYEASRVLNYLENTSIEAVENTWLAKAFTLKPSALDDEIKRESIERLGKDLYEKILMYINKYKELSDKGYELSVDIKRLIEIEKEIPGVSEYLTEELGIEYFGRYPAELLLDQYRKRDDVESPYGVMLFPKSDHNGSFHLKFGVIEELYQRLKYFGINLRLTERSGKIGVARALIGYKKRYGESQKISFAIIGGHGTEDSIRFGDNDRNTPRGENLLKIEDLVGKGVQRSLGNEYFAEDPTIILISCSTGRKEGIGQKISDALGGEVIAPNVDTSVQSIRVRRGLGKNLSFNVRYSQQGIDVRYLDGIEIEEKN